MPAELTLVTIQPGSGSAPPLFCVHAEAGDVSLYYGIARHLATEQRVFGLCAPTPAELGAHRRLEQLATRHVREIRHAQPDGPYLIVGECTGGVLAYEIAQQLHAAGQEIALLALVDAFPTGAPPLARLMPRPVYRVFHRAQILSFHLGNLVRLGMADKLAYVTSKAERARTALTARVSGLLHRSAAAVSPQLAFREALTAYDPEPYAGVHGPVSRGQNAARDPGPARGGMGWSGGGHRSRDDPRILHDADLRARSEHPSRQAVCTPGERCRRGE